MSTRGGQGAPGESPSSAAADRKLEALVIALANAERCETVCMSSHAMGPFPSSSAIFDSSFKTLRMEIGNTPPSWQPIQTQMVRPAGDRGR